MKNSEIDKILEEIEQSGSVSYEYEEDGVIHTVTYVDDSKIFVVYGSDDDEYSVRDRYVNWVKSSNDVSKSFKKNIDYKNITVRKVWREYRVFECAPNIEFIAADGTLFSIDFSKNETVHICCGQKPTKWQLKKLKVASNGSIISSVHLSNEDYSSASKIGDRATDAHTECLEYCKREFFKGISAEYQALLLGSTRIATLDVKKETVYIYPEYMISVKHGLKTYGGSIDRYGLSAPEFAPPSKDFLRWKWISKLSRFANFVIFLASFAMALGLIIISGSAASTDQGAGIPMILCGFWMFPINIAGVALPFWLVDNDAIDVYDFKEKARFYLVYNLIYLGAALLFVGGGHLAAHFIWR